MAAFAARIQTLYVSTDGGSTFNELLNLTRTNIKGQTSTHSTTTNKSAGYEQHLPGFKSGSFDTDFLADESSTLVDAIWNAWSSGTQLTWRIRPAGDTGVKELVVLGTIERLEQLNEFSGVAKYSIGVKWRGAPVRQGVIPPPTSFSVLPAAYWQMTAIVANAVDDMIGSADLSVPATSGVSISAGGGRFGNALTFSGSGSTVVSATPPGLNANGNDGKARTILFWGKKTTTPSGDQLFYWTRGGASFAENGLAIRNNGSGLVALSRHPGLGLFPGSASLNVWHMFTTVRKPDGSGALYYIDDTQVYDSAAVFGVNIGGDLYLGMLYDGQYRANGLLIDELATFNVALTPTQIAELYTRGVAGTPIVIP